MKTHSLNIAIEISESEIKTPVCDCCAERVNMQFVVFIVCFQPGVRASKLAADGKLIQYYHEDVKTTHEAMLHGLRVSSTCI